MLKLCEHFPVEIWCFIQLTLSTGVLSSIQEGPSNFLKEVGDNVRFICQTDINSCDGIDWTKTEGSQSAIPIFKNGSGLLNDVKFPSARYSVSSRGDDGSGCSLSISNLEMADSGIFGCIESRGGKDDMKNAVLVVFANPSCSPKAFDDDIASGDTVSISCSVSMRLDLIMPSDYVRLTWLNSGLSLTSIVGSGTANSTLMLPYSRYAKPGDTFGFRCSLSLFVNQTSPLYDHHSPSKDICSFKNQHVLYGVTKIEFNESRTEFKQGENVFCAADGLPHPGHEWKDNTGNVVSSVTSYTITYNSSPGDEFTCTAKNMVKGKPYIMSKSLKVAKESPLRSPPLKKGSASFPAISASLFVATVCILLNEM